MAKSKSNAVKNILVMFFVALIAVSILAVLNQVTKQPIADADEKARQEAYLAAYGVEAGDSSYEITDIADFDAKLNDYTPAQAEANVTINAVLEAKKDGGQVGYVIDATSPNGYGGDVQVAVGISNEGKIVNLKVVSASNETPGLGAKSTEDEFQSEFSGLSALSPVEYSKTGANRDNNEFDAISSATYTTTAVKEAVNESINFYNTMLKGE